MSKTIESAISHEVTFLRAGLEQLKDYLLSKELFWNSGLGSGENGRAFPQLTLGNLLFSKQVVEAAGVEPQLLSQLQALKEEWKTAWQTKAEREFDSRFSSWREYIVFLKQYASADSRDFDTEVRQRALLELLRNEAPDLSDNVLQVLDIEDQHLRGISEDGDFIWDEALMAAFPKDRFWFLYGKPNPKKK